MLSKTYWVCADILSLGSQLSTARDLPSPDVLMRRIDSLFEQMARKAHEAGIAEADMPDIRYALAAYIDEQILKSPWPGRNQWLAKPLQYAYFNENTAGEGFFVKMEALRNSSRMHVLEVYYLCLTLGFQGIYAVRNDIDGLNSIIERAGSMLARALPPSEQIAPHGLPKDGGRGRTSRDAPIVLMGVTMLLLSVGTFFALRYMLNDSANNAAKRMNDTAQTASEGR